MFTLNDLMRWRAELHGESTALVDDRGDRATYAEIHERSLDAGRWWLDQGIQSGDVVGLLDTNSVVFFEQLLGLSRIGAIPALMNWRLTAAENEAIFKVVEPVAVAAGVALIERVPATGNLQRVALNGAQDGWLTWPAPVTPQTPDLPLPPLPTDVVAIAFSSGTTGVPKGIPWRHESLARSTMVDGAEIAGMNLGSRHLVVAPTFHLAGLSNCLMGLARGAELHLRTAFDPDAVLDDIASLGVEYITVVPAMFGALVRAAAGRSVKPDTSSLVESSYGASPIAPELVAEVRDLFPGVRLRQFYGMTEVAGALTTLTPADHDGPHQQSAGRVTPGFDAKLVRPDGAEVGDGEPGQIMVRSSSLMTGYWNDQEATDQAIVDGWFATGDIAIRNDGYLTIMDRAKDMIVSGGENVYPAEVEAVLYAHPDVIEAAVIGVPDETFGERVHAVIVGEGVDLASVQDFCRPQLAGYKLPRSLDVVDELPRNATGKLLKRELREPYWRDQDRSV